VRSADIRKKAFRCFNIVVKPFQPGFFQFSLAYQDQRCRSKQISLCRVSCSLLLRRKFYRFSLSGTALPLVTMPKTPGLIFAPRLHRLRNRFKIHKRVFLDLGFMAYRLGAESAVFPSTKPDFALIMLQRFTFFPLNRSLDLVGAGQQGYRFNFKEGFRSCLVIFVARHYIRC